MDNQDKDINFPPDAHFFDASTRHDPEGPRGKSDEAARGGVLGTVYDDKRRANIWRCSTFNGLNISSMRHGMFDHAN